MVLQPAETASCTTWAGNISTFFVVLGLTWDISQFWQFRQARVQPAVAMEKLSDEGR